MLTSEAADARDWQHAPVLRKSQTAQLLQERHGERTRGLASVILVYPLYCGAKRISLKGPSS